MQRDGQVSFLERELLNTNNKLLFLGGHCDDIELFCGKLLLERKGHREHDPNAYGLVTAAGPVTPWITRMAVYAYNRAVGSSKVRIAESMQAMGQLGIDNDNLTYLQNPQFGLHRFPECIEDILIKIRKIDPDLVVMPAYEGGHVDHDTTNLFGWLAALASGISSDKIIEYAAYRFEQNSQNLIIQEFKPKNGFSSFFHLIFLQA